MTTGDSFQDQEVGSDAGELPWERHPSIYEHICAHIRRGQPGLTEGGQTLPDETPADPKKRLKGFAAVEGVAAHHAGRAKNGEHISLVDALIRYCQTPNDATRLEVYNLMKTENAVRLVDNLLNSLCESPFGSHARLYELALFLAMMSPDQGPVKFGVAILGLFRRNEDIEILLALGRHEGLALYCAVAIANSSYRPDADLWALAKNLGGWGRISVVERMTGTNDPEIKEWLLRRGYRNTIMYEYLALACAKGGGLLEALRRERVDRELLTCAGEIIRALIRGAPGPGMGRYDQGAEAAQAFLNRVPTDSPSLGDICTVHAIKEFITKANQDWADIAGGSWSDELRSRVTEQCEQIIALPIVREIVSANLASPKDRHFNQAARVAPSLGIDTWDYHWKRLRQTPQDSGRWDRVMRACDESRIDEVMSLAEQSLPLDQLAAKSENGKGSANGSDSQVWVHGCLDMILQDLKRFPGRGVKLLLAGLQSPVVGNRNMAVKAVAGWKRDVWPAELKSTLKQVYRSERDPKIRHRIKTLLNGHAKR